MKLYFVAKTPTSGFVGQLSLEEIASQLRANQITGDYAATESTGPSYAETIKRNDVQWESVSQLVSGEGLSESAAPLTEASRTLSSVETRYADAYVVARAIAAIGSTIKVIGICLGILILIAGAAVGSEAKMLFVGGLFLGAIVAIPIYILGVLVSAQAEVLKATLDTAVHTSPFLTKENMARVMSL
jgi:hypothetical protein